MLYENIVCDDECLCPTDKILNPFRTQTITNSNVCIEPPPVCDENTELNVDSVDPDTGVYWGECEDCDSDEISNKYTNHECEELIDCPPDDHTDLTACVLDKKKNQCNCHECLNGTYFDEYDNECIQCQDPKWCLGNISCIDSRTDIGCTECDLGYYADGLECLQCTDNNVILIIIGILIIFLLIL